MRRAVARIALLAAVPLVSACSSGGGATQGPDASADGPAADGPPDDAAGDGAGDDAPQGDAGPFDMFQVHNLDVVNKYRATKGIAPLRLDAQLCAFALAGSKQETMDHTPHAHFNTAAMNGSLWMDGFVTMAGENQGDPNGWSVLASNPTTNELMQIDAIQKAMFDEGPGAGEAHAHYENIMNAQFDRLGVGLVEVSGMLYLTNDFSAD